MGDLETITSQSGSQIQYALDMQIPNTSLIDSDKLVIAGGSFNQVVTTTYHTSIGTFPGLDILRSAISVTAMHDARQRFPTPKDIPDAYPNIKETILGWSTQADQPAILCFTGGLKSGTSAIAHEIAETLSSRGTLAGTFFFEADKSQDDGDIFLTLAYQLAVNIPGMDNLVNKAVLRDPTILQKRGEVQLTKLILEPLFCLPTPETPFVVIVDEFDLCKSFAAQQVIISLLSRASVTFGNMLRFVIFTLQTDFTAVIDKDIYHWVGRHISLEDDTLRYSPLCSSQLANQFFDPFPSPVDSINKMWTTISLIGSGSTNFPPLTQAPPQHSHSIPYHHASHHDAFLGSALPNAPTDVIGKSAIVPAGDHFQGSPMFVDILRGNPHGTAGSPMIIDSLRYSPRYGGSPMIIDSLRSSPRYGGSPMHIDSTYLSQRSGIDSESAFQFNATSASNASGLRGTVGQNPPINTLYVGNLPTSPPPLGMPNDYLEEKLREIFSARPGFRRLCFRHKASGPMCFVEFEDITFASRALREMAGDTLHGIVKHGIRLSYSKNPLGIRTLTNAGGSGSSGGPTPLQS